MNSPINILKTVGAVLIGLLSMQVVAEESAASKEDEYARLKNFSVLGDANAAQEVAGSAHFIGPEELANFAHSDVLRVLRDVPGVYLQDEEGFGLRPNIGIRGSGLDRSARITLLEDGVPIAPAPYAAPAAYYFPGVQRMHAVEVVKGPAAIALGPRTTGGAINMISTPVPDALTGMLELTGGENGLFQGTARIGDAAGRVAWLIEANHQQTDGFKRLDDGGDTGYRLNDYIAKLRFASRPGDNWDQSLELKLGYWAQDADETYVGLTDEDFAADPYRRYAGSRLDHLSAHHAQFQATWNLTPVSGAWDLGVTAYRNEFHRNWFKLGKVGGTSISSVLQDPSAFAQELSWLRGDADSPDDALNLRNNNRRYVGQGIQALLTKDLAGGPLMHEVEFGLRLHEDEEDRLQDEDLYRISNGQMVLTSDGAPGSQDNRLSSANAVALHLSDRMHYGAWTITPGIRYEHVSLRRDDYALSDPLRTDGAQRVRRNKVDVFVPGIGATWRASPSVLLIGGINRGFNPPAPGGEASAEKSVNLEAGVRYRKHRLSFEAIGFISDYDNLVGTCTASTGGNCNIGDQFDGGQATVLGLELGARYRLADVSRYALSIPLDFNYTWTPTAEFDTAFASGFEPWGDVQAGDRMPYVPEHQLQIGTGLEGQRWRMAVKANYQDRTRTVAGSGPIDAAQSTDSRVVFDLAVHWQLKDRLQLTGRVENLFDEVYNVARRPAGSRPGMPRRATLGFRYDL